VEAIGLGMNKFKFLALG